MTDQTEALHHAIAALESARKARDEMPHGTARSATNVALDRLDVAISAVRAAQPQPAGKRLTAEEMARTDGKAGAFIWWVNVDPGAYLYTVPAAQPAPEAVPLPERFIRFALRDLRQERQRLKGFLSLGNEVTRAAEYDQWIAAVQAYVDQHYEPLPGQA